MLVQLLCLPSPDLLAASTSRSVFATKQASHTAVRERNLRELDAKQGMIGKDKASTVHGPPSTEKPKPLSLASLQDLSAINIPPDDGQILEVWSPPDRGGQPSSPTVILLQDLHTQAEAQQAEGRILQHLHKTYNLKLVAAEGAEGPFALEFFKQFPEDRQLRADVAKTFLAAGELTGHEYQIITEQLPITVYGVEDMTLHAENTEVYRQVLDVAPVAQEVLTRIQQALAALESTLYPEPLQELRAHAAQFQAGTLAMPDYVAFLAGLAQQHQVSVDTVAPNLVRFQSLQMMEPAINRDQVQVELQQLLSAIVDRRPQGEFSTPPRHARGRSNENGSSSSSSGVPSERSESRDGVEKPQDAQGPEELAVLLDQFQRQAIAPAYFYPRLIALALARDADLDLTGYASVVAFSAYLELTQVLQHHRLLPELEQLEWALTERLAGSDDAQTLAKLVRHAQLLRDLFSLKLTPDQVVYYQAHRDEFTAKTFTAFLKRPEGGFSTPPRQARGRSNENDVRSSSSEVRHSSLADGVEKPQLDLAAVLDAHLPLAERFYALAYQRDRVLLDNTLALVQGREASLVKREAAGTSSVTADSQARPLTHDVRRATNDTIRPEAVLLVAGGFHTPGVTALLRERQIPYVVITPTAAGELDEALYHRLIRGQRAPLEELLQIPPAGVGGLTTAAPHGLLPVTAQGTSPQNPTFLQEWVVAAGVRNPRTLEFLGTPKGKALVAGVAVALLAAILVTVALLTDGQAKVDPSQMDFGKAAMLLKLSAIKAKLSPSQSAEQQAQTLHDGLIAEDRALLRQGQGNPTALRAFLEVFGAALTIAVLALVWGDLDADALSQQLGTQLAELGADGALAVGESDISQGIGSVAGAAAMMRVRPGASVSYASNVKRVSLEPLGVTGAFASVSGLEIDLMKMLSGSSPVSMVISASPRYFPLTSQEFVAFMNYIVDLQKAGSKSSQLRSLIEKEIDRSISGEAGMSPVDSMAEQNKLRRQQWKEAAKSLLDKAFAAAKQEGYIGLQRFGDRWYQRVPSGSFVLIPVSGLPEEEGVWSIQLGRDLTAQLTAHRVPQAGQKNAVVVGVADLGTRSMNPLETLEDGSEQEVIAGTEGRIRLSGVSGVDKEHAAFSWRRPHLIGELRLSMLCVSDGKPDWGQPSKGGTWIQRTVDAQQEAQLRESEEVEENEALVLAFQVDAAFKTSPPEEKATKYAADALKQGFDLPQMIQRNPIFPRLLGRAFGFAVVLALLIYFNLPVDQALESQELVDASQLGKLAEETSPVVAMAAGSNIMTRRRFLGAAVVGAIVILSGSAALIKWFSERGLPTPRGDETWEDMRDAESQWLNEALAKTSLSEAEKSALGTVVANLYSDNGAWRQQAEQSLVSFTVYGGRPPSQMYYAGAHGAKYAEDFAVNAMDHIAIRVVIVQRLLVYMLAQPNADASLAMRDAAVRMLDTLAGVRGGLGIGAIYATQELEQQFDAPVPAAIEQLIDGTRGDLKSVQEVFGWWKDKEASPELQAQIDRGSVEIDHQLDGEPSSDLSLRDSWQSFYEGGKGENWQREGWKRWREEQPERLEQKQKKGIGALDAADEGDTLVALQEEQVLTLAKKVDAAAHPNATSAEKVRAFETEATAQGFSLGKVLTNPKIVAGLILILGIGVYALLKAYGVDADEAKLNDLVEASKEVGTGLAEETSPVIAMATNWTRRKILQVGAATGAGLMVAPKLAGRYLVASPQGEKRVWPSEIWFDPATGAVWSNVTGLGGARTGGWESFPTGRYMQAIGGVALQQISDQLEKIVAAKQRPVWLVEIGRRAGNEHAAAVEILFVPWDRFFGILQLLGMAGQGVPVNVNEVSGVFDPFLSVPTETAQASKEEGRREFGTAVEMDHIVHGVQVALLTHADVDLGPTDPLEPGKPRELALSVAKAGVVRAQVAYGDLVGVLWRHDASVVVEAANEDAPHIQLWQAQWLRDHLPEISRKNLQGGGESIERVVAGVWAGRGGTAERYRYVLPVPQSEVSGSQLWLGPHLLLGVYSDASAWIKRTLGTVTQEQWQQIRGIRYDWTQAQTSVSGVSYETDPATGKTIPVRILIIARDILEPPAGRTQQTLEAEFRKRLEKRGVLPTMPRKGEVLPKEKEEGRFGAMPSNDPLQPENLALVEGMEDVSPNALANVDGVNALMNSFDDSLAQRPDGGTMTPLITGDGAEILATIPPRTSSPGLLTEQPPLGQIDGTTGMAMPVARPEVQVLEQPVATADNYVPQQPMRIADRQAPTVPASWRRSERETDDGTVSIGEADASGATDGLAILRERGLDKTLFVIDASLIGNATPAAIRDRLGLLTVGQPGAQPNLIVFAATEAQRQQLQGTGYDVYIASDANIALIKAMVGQGLFPYFVVSNSSLQTPAWQKLAPDGPVTLEWNQPISALLAGNGLETLLERTKIRKDFDPKQWAVTQSRA